MCKEKIMAQGIGINNGDYPCKNEGKILKEYDLWSGMLERCTGKWHDRYTSYYGVSCSENFKRYSFFYEWCQEQKGFDIKDDNGKSWCLDKDILVKGNKVYSEDVCVFVPQRINKLLTNRKKERGEQLIGVSWYSRDQNYVSRCNNGTGVPKHLGYFGTEMEAFLAYKSFKEHYIKEIANDYRTQLDPRAYQALMNYQVEVTD